MKKVILLALTALMMVGCNDEKVRHKVIDNYSIEVVDSCEYIRFNLSNGSLHKGNCRFCKERDSIKWEKRKKELDELILKLKEK